MLEGAYQKGQREAGQVKQDIQRGRDEAEQMREDVSQQTQTTESSSPTSVPVR